ncbi:hypothetical protein UFOVP164_24 [uncultured Caudovirales phage]|uniref:Uncharacterized protein n=1 Tax=uncultured Caudovirales phage TaxID=2100421 RepID=A0A6J7XM92_9CAUD|nr:hypothetical protein UFOVP164_24 [uncultured Caudovirales phage]
MTKDEALKFALEALEDLGMKHFESTGEVLYKETVTAIKEALAQPEQEPCTRVECMGSKGCIGNCWNKKQPQQELVCVCGAVLEGQELIYTTPQRTWVGLTDDELSEVYNQADWDTVNGWEYERAIEAKLKEKNT